MRALAATPENFRSSLEPIEQVDIKDLQRLWPALAPEALPTTTLRLIDTLRRGYFTMPRGSLLGVTVYDMGNNSPSAARLNLYEPRRFAHDQEGTYFFDTVQVAPEDVAVQGGLQVLEGPFDSGRSKELYELIADAKRHAA